VVAPIRHDADRSIAAQRVQTKRRRSAITGMALDLQRRWPMRRAVTPDSNYNALLATSVSPAGSICP
jgi:hypothetical protein